MAQVYDKPMTIQIQTLIKMLSNNKLQVLDYVKSTVAVLLILYIGLTKLAINYSIDHA